MNARGTRGSAGRWGSCRWLGLGALALALGGGPGCSKEDAFRDAMYPKNPHLPPPVNYDLTAAAALTPLVASGFDAPAAAAACLSELLAVPPLAEHLELTPTFRARVATMMAYAACADPIEDPYTIDENPGRRRRRCAASHLGSVLVPPATPESATGGVTATGPFGVACANSGSLSPLDELRLVRVITDLAETVAANEQMSSGQTRHPLLCWGPTDGGCASPDDRRRYELGVQRAIALGVALLEHDPAAHRAPGAPALTSYPTLALSGGAANGAFTAGYLHALLSFRLAALQQLGNAAQRATADARYRIGTVAGTSVGSLVALLLDLYFAPELPAEPAEPRLPDELFPGCNHDGPMDVDWHERCALASLETIFNHTEEGDLLCAERGSVVGLLSPPRLLRWLWRADDHLLRFDPLLEELLAPFVARFHRVMLDNDLVRLTVGADLTQNVALGLDERACRLPGVDPEACILLALQTSITEPVFVPPVRQVYSGVYLDAGEGSPRHAASRLTWFDGGLRSGTPADLALLRAGGAEAREDPSWARVLAVTTTPYEGIAKAHPKDGLTTFFDSTFDAVDQVRKWEIAHAQLLADARRTSLVTFSGRRSAAVAPPTDPPEGAAAPETASPDDALPPLEAALGAGGANAAPPGSGTERTSAPRPRTARARGIAPPIVSASVLPIFVPSTIEPRALFAAGYQFDPTMMRGLYRWGELTFLRGYERILRFLRWEGLLDWVDAEAWLLEQRWLAEGSLCLTFGVGDDCRTAPRIPLLTDADLTDHYRHRRRAVKRNVKKCSRE